MGTAYTPGLTVSPSVTIRKQRRLPAKGSVLVEIGQKLDAQTIVARTEVPGYMQTVRVAESLGLEPDDAIKALWVEQGDIVTQGQIVAQTKSFWGLFKSDCKTPIAGTVELISPATGHIGVRAPARPVEVNAYLEGTVCEVIPDEGVVVETVGALVQGIFGIGGERFGELVVPVGLAQADITESAISESYAGKVLVGGAGITESALHAAAKAGICGIVVGAIIDTDLIGYLGHDIGVAITGQEEIVTSVILTEGFGDIRMAARTWKLLKSLDGCRVSMNGATQIRAGVIRPEIISCGLHADSGVSDAAKEHNLDIGVNIRVIREPYFGRIGTVHSLPPAPVEIETGAVVRILEAKLEDGSIVKVPRANVEIIVE
jgi:hypothetical protein